MLKELLEKSKISRKELSKKMDIPYGTLCYRLGEFGAWPEGEEERACAVLREMEQEAEQKGGKCQK